MRPRSDRWDATVVGAHRIAVEVTVLYNRLPLPGQAALAVVSGNVTMDRTAAQLGRVDATFAEPLLVPNRSGPLSPYGYELQVKRGITYADGKVELMPLGVYPIQTSQSDGVTLATQIAATDRSQLVKDARLEDDYLIAAGVNYATAIQALIADGVDGLVYQFTPTPYTTPLLPFAAQADRWDVAQGMATAIGCDLYFDGVGTLMLRPSPTFTEPVWTIAEGPEGLLVGASLAQDRAPAFNRIIAVGQNSSLGAIPRGVWTDTAATSPSRYGSGFGQKPRFYSSPFLTTGAQALSAATALGANIAGVARSLSFAAVPNCALEGGDPILVKRIALGVDEVHLIDSLTIGLTADGAMSGSSRALVSA
ncbi:MAG: DUF5047 domain-containing protein [Ilumatobacteraceae bacterium]